MPGFDLSVTVCSWNTAEDLRRCLASLAAERAGLAARFEVVVVDNASIDGSPDMVEREFGWVRLLRLTENLGFTGGHNLAISQRQGRHVALLNSDTVVHPGAIETLLATLETYPSVGVVGPKLLNPDGSLQFSCRRFPNPVAAAFRNTFLGRLFPENRSVRDYLMKDFDHCETREVDWVSGAAMFIHARALETLGGLDPAFFMYCEDTDYCRRAHDAGLRVVYEPAAVVTHAIGRSTDRVANAMIVRFHRSMLRYTRKHLVSKAPWPSRPFLYTLAAGALAARAALFLSKNAFDDLRRRVGRWR